ncbi:hypothetical protein HY989_01065 [Candidatus Micrarchaeota archaeon]|nr:hypothetical protein [Candidatus Micrarchaeota archaeon]
MRSSNWQEEQTAFYRDLTAEMDFKTLKPFSHLQFHPLFAKEWCEWILEICTEIEKRKMPPSDLHKFVDGPSETLDNLYFTLLDLKSAKIPLKDRKKIALFFHSIIKSWRGRDAYNRKANLIHSQLEVDSLLRGIPFLKGNPEIAKLLGKITNSGYQLVDGLFSDIYMGNGFEYFGKYKSDLLGKNQILVIKSFQNLKPISLWSNARSFPADRVKIYCIYENVDFWLDGVTCHSQYRGDPIKGLKKWALEMDGEFIGGMNHAIGLNKDLSEICQEQWITLLALDFEHLKQRGLEFRCFFLNRLRRHLELVEGPSGAMRKAVKGKPFADEKYWKIPKNSNKRREYWKKLIDFQEEPPDFLSR